MSDDGDNVERKTSDDDEDWDDDDDWSDEEDEEW
jgi:hypothetical protein